jgi:antitoxin component YwqK of YwqJK toxin-antitoxin module
LWSRKWRESWTRDREEEVVPAALQEEVLSESKEKSQECSVEDKKANGEMEQEVEGQWRRGGGALKFRFRVQG